jgi:putative ABC transport system ATP-binding protein
MSEQASKSPQARLRGLLSVEKNDLWVAVIYSAAIGLFTLVLPVAVQALVNTIALGNLLQPLVLLSILVFVALVISGVLQGLRIYVVEHIQRRVFVRISSETIHRLLRAPAQAFDAHRGPELVNRFFDVVTLQKSGATLLIDGLSVATQSLVGMILLAVYHPWLLGFDILLLLAFLFVLFPLGSGAIATSINESKAKYALVAWLEETALFHGAFKPPSAMQYSRERTNQLVADYLDHRSKHFRILLRQILGSFGIQAVASGLLLGVGGWLVIQRQLTLGQLVAAEIVVSLILSGFSKLGKQLELYYDLAAAVDKLGYLQDLPEEPSGVELLPVTSEPARLRFREVSFGYGNGPALLSGVNWEVQPGQRIGLMGRHGSGKSTLLDLIYGARQVAGGAIEIDGFDLRELDRARLRSQVALVREGEIFDGSIADNVRMGRALDSSEIRSALAQVGLLEYCLLLPKGLETRLPSGGSLLSSGQAIRLLLARALASRPRLLLIDEALDHTDDSPELDAIISVLFNPQAPWTLILISSQSALLQRCAAIYEARNGKLEPMLVTTG